MAQFNVTTDAAALASARVSHVQRTAGTQHRALQMNMPMTRPTRSHHATAPSMASPAGTSFLKKFLVRLILLLVLVSAVWLLRSGTAGRGAPSPESVRPAPTG